MFEALCAVINEHVKCSDNINEQPEAHHLADDSLSEWFNFRKHLLCNNIPFPYMFFLLSIKLLHKFIPKNIIDFSYLELCAIFIGISFQSWPPEFLFTKFRIGCCSFIISKIDDLDMLQC